MVSRPDPGSPEDGLVALEAAWLSRDDLQPRTEQLPSRYRLVFERMAEFNRDIGSVSGDPANALVPDEELANLRKQLAVPPR